MTPLFFFQDLTCLFENANHSDDVAPAFLKHGRALVAKVVINMSFSSETTCISGLMKIHVFSKMKKQPKNGHSSHCFISTLSLCFLQRRAEQLVLVIHQTHILATGGP
jgi:hypothetical protein